MNAIATLLVDFGFTLRDAGRITECAHENGLDLADVQAWIDEARSSTSLHNPRGFVRARIQDGDKPPPAVAADCHHTPYRRYKSQRFYVHTFPPSGAKAITQTCKCGRVVYKTHFCNECGLCPTCCECEPPNPDKE